MNIGDIKFPAVAVMSSGFFHFLRNTEDLTICNKRGLVNGFYNNLNIIDSSGMKVSVAEVEKVKFLGYNIFLERKYRCFLKFSKERIKIDLKEFKEILINGMKKNEHSSSSSDNVQQKIDLIEKGSSIFNVISSLTHSFYQEYK